MLLTEEGFQRILTNNESLNKMAASGGSLLIDDTDNHTGSFTSFYVREDTVVNALTGKDPNGGTINFLTLFDISATTLKFGDLFIAPHGCRITLIDLTSGSIIAYL